MSIARRIASLERPGCRIHYEVSGEGPAIVFAHGLGGNHMSWFQQVAHFAPRYTCIAFAHRGFAPSSPIAGGPDPADYAADLAALVDHLKLDDVRIVAQSMGGWSAIEYALTRPPALKALVLAGTTGTIDPQQIDEPERARLADWHAERVRAHAGPLRARHSPGGRRTHGARATGAAPALSPHRRSERRPRQRALAPAPLRHAHARAGGRCAISPAPSSSSRATKTSSCPPFAADALARVAPRAQVAHIEDAGHSAYFERAARFNRIVDDFFASLR